MAYTFISNSDKSYTKKFLFCLFEEIVSLSLVFLLLIPFILLFTSEVNVKNFLLLITFVFLVVFLKSLFSDIFSRMITGVKIMGYALPRKYKSFINMLWAYFWEMFIWPSRVALVTRDFDGFGNELRFNFIVSVSCSFFTGLVVLVFRFVSA